MSGHAEARATKGRQERRKVRQAVRLGQDPLLRSAERDAHRAWLIPLLVLGAIAAHIVFTVGVGFVARTLATTAPRSDEETIEVAIQETVSEPVPQPEPEPEPVPEPEPEPVREPEPEPEPEPKPQAKARPKPPPSPKPEEEPKPPPRRVIGLDLGSTVEGGSGPSFSVGNALDGKTASKAADPRTVKDNPGRSTEPVKGPTSPNRAAANIPRTGVVLVKPKRTQRIKPVYPPKLKAQQIEANVVVEVEIAKNGKVSSVRILSPANEPEFNEAAKIAAKQETFSPATRDGVAIPFRLSFTYRFRLDD